MTAARGRYGAAGSWGRPGLCGLTGLAPRPDKIAGRAGRAVFVSAARPTSKEGPRRSPSSPGGGLFRACGVHAVPGGGRRRREVLLLLYVVRCGVSCPTGAAPVIVACLSVVVSVVSTARAIARAARSEGSRS
ncbi:MAG: hypothetical protein ACRDYA_21145 [Egibacteraceae bacterium]